MADYTISDSEYLNMERCRSAVIQKLIDYGLDLDIMNDDWEDIVDKLNTYSNTSFVDAYLDGTYSGVYRNDSVTHLASVGSLISSVSGFIFPNVISVASSLMRNTLARFVILPKANLNNYMVESATQLYKLVAPRNSINAACTNATPALQIFDYGSPSNMAALYNSTKPNFEYLILRKSDNITTLSNVNLFSDSKFVTGGGKCFVPNSLISTYRTASNWSALSGTTFINIVGSRFESLDWWEKNNSVCTLDGNIKEVNDDETVAIFKHTENIEHLYEDGVEITDTTELVKGRTFTSTI